MSAQAQARVVEITSVTNASNYVDAENEYNTPVIYGGTAGEESLCKSNSDSLCNTCAIAPSFACNERRIHSNLKLRITFKVTGDNTGYIFLAYNNNGMIMEMPLYTRSTSAMVTKGDEGFVEVAWGQICQAVSGDSSCFENTFSQIYIAISSDPAGRKSVYLTDLRAIGNYPEIDNVPFRALRLYASTTGFTDINYATPFFSDLTIDTDGGVSPVKVKGLKADTTYFFKTAMIDAAGNISLMTDNSQIIADGCPALASTGNRRTDLKNDEACPYMATPTR